LTVWPGDNSTSPANQLAEPSPIGQDWPWGDTVWRYIFGDTQQANEARAFRVGYYGKFTSTDKFYLSVSIRIRKLGIPEVSVQAWDLDPGRYFVVLMRFGEGYMPTPDASEFASKISFRIGTSETYKPSEADVVQAFSQDVTTPEDSRPRDSWKPTFISPQLNELFNERFGSILEARKRGMDWAGAEMYVDDVKCGRIDPRASVPARYLEREKTGSRHVDVVTQDHFYAGWDFQKPFATIAMGFALRHFVRCTEFCLTCHRKLPYQLEAIKPYVCDGLCLYQYMNYSLGPSLEHEILTQPYVVDLLISLCYTSAAEGALRLFPSGLSLKVPYFGEGNTNPMSKVKMKTDTMELLFDGQHSLEAGGWVAIREHNPKGHHGCYHHRVEEVSGSSARLSLQVRTTVPGISEWKFTSQYVHVEVVKYETNLDDLTDEERRKAIALQLCLLPSVKEMTEYLKVGGRTLESWESLNRAALGLLRWIVASNRSCIMQVEDKAKIDGMAGYLQFRFAMGSPVRLLVLFQ
jgi:ubiquitin-conjugating enzyme E2 Q